jgi:hypothetical protein
VRGLWWLPHRRLRGDAYGPTYQAKKRELRLKTEPILPNTPWASRTRGETSSIDSQPRAGSRRGIEAIRAGGCASPKISRPLGTCSSR